MNAGDDMAYKFSDVGGEMSYHLAGVFSGIKFKALVASVPAAFSTYFGGNWGFFETWFALSVIDLVFGVAHALKTDSFSRAKLYGWIVKALTHMLTILVCGVITVMLIGLTGHSFPLIDWFIFVLVLTEAASILKSAEKLGLPVHPLAKALIEKLRKRATGKLSEIAEGKEEEK
ncbi:MAG: phage holin family protein [Candidatus Accumulibacter sp.]|jgi:phage-related holin|nr:phage holin family protein [Accumulibacter sp.]